jgi:hypothetical protein
MLLLNALLSFLLLTGSAGAIYSWRQNRQREILNNRIADELDAILFKTADLVQKQKERLPKIGNHGLEDPGMLSTIITVVVSKFGTLRLGLEDFTAVKDEDYVSVYIDVDTNDLILSLNHTSSDRDRLGTATYGSPDDTFH